VILSVVHPFVCVPAQLVSDPNNAYSKIEKAAEFLSMTWRDSFLSLVRTTIPVPGTNTVSHCTVDVRVRVTYHCAFHASLTDEGMAGDQPLLDAIIRFIVVLFTEKRPWLTHLARTCLAFIQ
jgi:hypothetical protein